MGRRREGELRGNRGELGEPVDRGGVVRRFEPGGGGEVRRDVEGVLRAKLKAALDRPAQVGVGAQFSRGARGVQVQVRERFA